MKEMKYQFERKIEVLDTGFCFGLLYYILNLGTHPTAYIKMPDNINIIGQFSKKAETLPYDYDYLNGVSDVIKIVEENL